jgi:antitoxin component of MazEF toxin-antitoxin module
MARKKPKKDVTFKQPPPPKAVMETRVFKSGNSYAVRLPKVLYAGGEGSVYVKKLDNGKLLISAKGKAKWPVGFFESFGTLPDDFEAPSRPKADSARDERIARIFDED